MTTRSMPRGLMRSTVGRSCDSAGAGSRHWSLGHAAPAKKTFDLPAGEASTTLRQFADQAGEQLLYTMATVQGVHFDPESSWDEKKEIWKLSGKIVKTTNITQSAIGVGGEWTTVVAATVFVF